MMRRLILLAFTADIIFSVSCSEERAGPYRPRERCNSNEVFSECPAAACRPQSCSEVGYSVACIDLPPDGKCPGKPGCICKEGYVRNNKGICIPMKSCPSCGGDPNALSGCGVNCGKLCSNYNNGSVGCPAVCYNNSCDCKRGYVYDDNTNKCVLPEQCTPTCKTNEVYDSCPAPCPPQRCDVDPALVLCSPNPKPGDPECKPGCRCKDNFSRNSTGDCIPRDECPKCPQNQVYDPCPAPCPPRRCDVDERVIRCAKPPEVGDPECEPGCRCQDGYKKDSNGDCIPSDQCPKCGVNEVYDLCPSTCPPKRCDVDERTISCSNPPKLGDPDCKPGCRCKDGYKRDGNGTCIDGNQCKPFCGYDEVASDCVNGGCGPKTCSELGFPTKCVKPKTCRKGCLCKDDYLRNDDGFCIPKTDCSPVCGSNEVYNDCANAFCGAKNCSQIGRPIACPAVSECIGGCLCKEGYLRAKNGTCIPEKKCPPSCSKPHEYYDPCPSNCPPNTCDSLDRVYDCPNGPVTIDGSRYCYGACKCEPGYYRNSIGECIAEEDCRKCMGPHEYFSCGVFCDNVCKTLKKQNQTNCPIATFVCVKQCYCEKDYARAANGTCIPIRSCEEPQCPMNEMYVNNPETLCEPEYCTELGFPMECPIELEPGCVDEPGCICMDGYLRNDSGVCVPKTECPSCGGDPNAQAGCGVNCRRCSNYKDKSIACPDICEVNGCECKEGYIYDDNKKKCVLPEQCTLCTGPNEEYDSCPPMCPPQTCESIGKIYSYPAMFNNTKNCKPACRCKKGYYRNSIGECISEENCLRCPGKHEYFSCGVACDNECDMLDVQSKEDCPIYTFACVEQCYCEDGYARDIDNNCVPIEDCEGSCNNDPNARQGCGINCNKRCSDIGKEPQMCIALCKENACDCKDGFYLNEITGRCVLPNDCPKTCGKNEVYSTCIQGQCGPKTCKQLGRPVSCPRINPDFCKAGCLCKEGYVRADNGTCIPEKQCPSCGGDRNAQAGCGGHCNNRCSSYGREPEACTPICGLNQCDCKDGFVYDDQTRKCVRPKDCTAPKCGKNEVLSDCVNGGCDKRKCSDYGKPDICIDPLECVKGCVCKENYLRENNGTCVPTYECTSCNDDPNAKPGCGINCNKKCSDIGGEQKACILVCYDNACDCKDGYYVDGNSGKCVLPEDCTPTCGKNEIYSNCTNQYCSPSTCSQLGKPLYCPATNARPCIAGCMCQNGYVRDDNGICIPKKECPSCGGDPNAISGCGTNCGRLCSNYNKFIRACSLACNSNGCDCKPDYVYDPAVKKCVLPKDCKSTTDEGNTTPSSKTSPSNDTNALELLEKGNLAMTGAFLNFLYDQDPSTSYVFSAISIIIALGQLELYAVGPTFEQLSKALNLQNDEQIRSAFPELTRLFEGQTNVTLELAVKCYGNINYKFSQQFLNDSINVFNAESENVDFAQNKEAADEINSWVANKTHNLIPTIVTPDMFSRDTVLTIVNAIYFLGNWEIQFPKENTKKRDFYITANKTKSIDFMQNEKYFEYREDTDLDAQCLRLYYKGRNMSIIIYLPNQKDGLGNMIKKLRDPKVFSNNTKSFSSEKVNVLLPKFKIDSTLDLNDLLAKFNITYLFDATADGLKGILYDNSAPLFVSKAIQKAFINVDETGTEAAAATGVIVGTRALPAPPSDLYTFIADHPFVFDILLGDVVIFCGYFSG